MRSEDQLVAAAVFAKREAAEEAWERLIDAGIPATVISDPALLGGRVAVNLMVERHRLDEAQRLVADLV